MTQKKKETKNVLGKYQKKLWMGIIIYSLFALLVVPIYTFLLAGQDNPLQYSISIIGNAQGNRHFLICWTVLSGGFFVCFLYYLLLLTKNRHCPAKFAVCVASSALIACNLIPFVPNQYPRLAQYHNFLALSASWLLAWTLFVFVISLKKFDRTIYQKAMGLFILCALSCGVPFFTYGVNGFLEAMCILMVCLFLFFVLLLMLKSDAFEGANALLYADAEKHKRRAEKWEKRAMRAERRAAGARKKAKALEQQTF